MTTEISSHTEYIIKEASKITPCPELLKYKNCQISEKIWSRMRLRP